LRTGRLRTLAGTRGRTGREARAVCRLSLAVTRGRKGRGRKLLQTLARGDTRSEGKGSKLPMQAASCRGVPRSDGGGERSKVEWESLLSLERFPQWSR